MLIGVGKKSPAIGRGVTKKYLGARRGRQSPGAVKIAWEAGVGSAGRGLLGLPRRVNRPHSGASRFSGARPRCLFYSAKGLVNPPAPWAGVDEKNTLEPRRGRQSPGAVKIAWSAWWVRRGIVRLTAVWLCQIGSKVFGGQGPVRFFLFLEVFGENLLPFAGRVGGNPWFRRNLLPLVGPRRS